MIEPGTEVEWTRTTVRGKSITIKRKYGTVLESDDNFSIVKSGKKKIRIQTYRLHESGSGYNQLTKLVIGDTDEQNR